MATLSNELKYLIPSNLKNLSNYEKNSVGLFSFGDCCCF